MSLGRVANKIALITGAGKGIGAATARLLAREGATIYVTDIDEVGGSEVTNDINNTGGTAHFSSLNTASDSEWTSLLKTIENKHGQLDVLVNNAGILQIGTIGNTTFDQWRKVQSVNSDGVFLGVKHAVELMRKHKTRGSIINLCSILGQVGTRDCVAYPASKGLVKLLTKSVALDEAPHGIRVNNVCPAYIETPLLDVMSKEEHDALLAMHPMGRLGRPEEVAQAILFLASNESSYVTGSELMVDGGYTAV